VYEREVLLLTQEPATHIDSVNNTSNKWPGYRNILSESHIFIPGFTETCLQKLFVLSADHYKIFHIVHSVRLVLQIPSLLRRYSAFTCT